MKGSLMALSLFAATALSFSAQAGLWITGDIRGALLPCFQCLETSEPGLARQVGVMRDKADEGIWLDAGGFLDGGEVDRLGLEASLALADRLGIQALHLTWRDVSPALVEALSGSSPALISASLVDGQGEPLVPASLVVEQGDQRIGVIGISGVPPEYRQLPAWQSFGELFRLREAGEALNDALDGLPGEVDRVVVLYAGDHGILRSLIDQAGERVDAFVMGSGFGNLYSVPPEGVIDARSQRGRRVTWLGLPDLAPDYHPVTLSAPVNESVAQALESAGLRHAPPAQESRPGISLSTDSDLSPPFAAPLLLEQDNRVMGMSVLGIETHTEWHGEVVENGDAYLVLDLLFENRKPFDLILQDSGQRALKVGNLHQNLVLLAGGKTHAALNRELPGDDLLPDTFELPQPGEVRRGKVAYRVTGTTSGSMSLRYYHGEYPPMAATIQEAEQPSWVQREVDLQRHPFLELGIANLQELDAGQLSRPADDRRVVAMDLLGRSQLTRTNPANHHDGDADPEATVETPRVVPYLYADLHIQLVSSDGYVYLPDWEFSDMERIPTFLPDLLSGGQLVFSLPEAVEDYRVSLYFPNFGTLTEGTQGFPEPMFFGENAEDFAYQERDTVVDFGLEQLRVRITDLERTEQGLEVEVEVFNETDGPGFWPMESRLGITSSTTQRRVTPSAITDPHGTPLAWNAHLPPREPRRMRLHFPLDEPSGEGLIDVRGLADNPSRPIAWDVDQVVVE
ncbi:hypothetical protein [Halomonas urumqiensis]|uniref:5'-Nucleotidase C-terminal domain-containing protein n=1 Tax=Halomonas urumqiensis TaxID=1684789 RepID=A0A2N7UGR9_9GAMM|nr:hypothetical protein [Halomonas urumqiensis]PMR79656.1 hypothetical protein C1H70_11140 [Halomonas urumqiensis]PTB03114.1 hypothetical protein C6V82_00940 [Halomonas urumqiensis]GHE20745.1 hypothetical protein GCM10017767_12660 [Halomonas urumqiensis]